MSDRAALGGDAPTVRKTVTDAAGYRRDLANDFQPARRLTVRNLVILRTVKGVAPITDSAGYRRSHDKRSCVLVI